MNPVQEAIQEMNQAAASGGNPTKGDQQQTPPAQQVQPPTGGDNTDNNGQNGQQQQPTKPQPPKKQTPPAKPAQPSAAEPKKNTAPPDPPFLEKKTTPAQGTPATQQAATAAEISDDAFFTHLSKVTRGMIKDKAGWESHIVSHNQLVEEKERGFEPNYKDARTKWVHQLMVQNAGKEPEAAMRILQALQFKPEGKSPREILYQAFQMDPKYHGMTETHFNAKYNMDFGILSKPIEELTPEQKDARLVAEMELNNRVADAKASIQKVIDDFQATEEKPRQIDERVTKSISSAVKKFSGLKLSFSDNPQENEILTIPIEDVEVLPSLEQDILDPDAAYNERIAEFETDKGYDYDALVRDSYERKYHKELRQMAYDHGFKMGQLAQINQDNNASNPKELAQLAQLGQGGGEQPGSFFEAMENAINKKRG